MRFFLPLTSRSTALFSFRIPLGRRGATNRLPKRGRAAGLPLFGFFLRRLIFFLPVQFFAESFQVRDYPRDVKVQLQAGAPFVLLAVALGAVDVSGGLVGVEVG
jgi:hypothetical protein